MNREEAIAVLKTLYPSHIGVMVDYNPDVSKALNRAIEALSARPTGEWIPCSERLPRDLLRVNVTWINHNPPVYYQHIKDIPQTDTAVRYNGNWYWWDATVIDVLAEYGEESGAEQINKDIEVVAWMPLPKPYREDGEA